MNEKMLLLIAFIGSLAGLFALFILSQNALDDENITDKIDFGDSGNTVKLEGKVVSIVEKEGVTFISLSHTTQTSVITFKNNVSLQKGEYIEVMGKSEEYGNTKEVIAQRIRVIDPSN